MTYEDPRTGKERNLGQDDGSAWSWITGLVVVAALAFGGWYFYNHSGDVASVNSGANPTAANVPSPQSSGPGVQGAPGSTNGPAADSSTGASSGTSGSADQGSQPSQDATGVKGAPGSTNGPAPDAPAPKAPAQQ